MQETENNMYKKLHSTLKPTKIICLLCPTTIHSQHWLGPPMIQQQYTFANTHCNNYLSQYVFIIPQVY
jgi:hypothetical protein